MNNELREYAKKRMTKVAFGFGLASVGLLIMFPTAPYLSLGLGAFALLLAILSATKKPYEKETVIAASTGIISIVVSITILVVVFVSFATKKSYRDNVLSLTDALYGETFEALYGTTMTEFFDNYFDGGNK